MKKSKSIPTPIGELQAEVGQSMQSFWGTMNVAKPDGPGMHKTGREAGQGRRDFGKAPLSESKPEAVPPVGPRIGDETDGAVD